MSPKVSILVPVYGVEKFIERCAISLFEQTFESIEYIFVNDCTKDNSINILLDVIKRYPHRKDLIHIIEHKQNKGLSGARNTGVDNASGEYILHVDSDDYIEVNMVELLYTKAIEENADVVICDFIMEWDRSSLLVKQELGNKSKEEFLESVYAGETMTCVWNKLIKKDLYTANNIRALEGINVGEDFAVIPLILFYATKIEKVNEYLYHYIQMNSNSYTASVNKKYVDDIVAVLEHLTVFTESINVDYLKTALMKCKVRKRLELIIKSNSSILDYVLSLFPESKTSEKLMKFNKRDQITLRVVNFNSEKLLKVYLFIFQKTFFILQKIKMR